jgi:hypothetical protein
MNEVNELTGFLCLGSLLLFPVMTFVVGFLAGRNRLPWSIKIERNRPQTTYVVEEGFEDEEEFFPA